VNWFHRLTWAFALGNNAVRGLSESDASVDPFEQFARWYGDPAVQKGMFEPTAMILSTVDKAGHPKTRTVLLKSHDDRGFVFYTNYKSAKGKNLAGRSSAALLFFWPELGRQVRVEGRATKVSAAESDDYFASRVRGSQIGAWASNQSAVIASREVLESRVKEFETRFASSPVPRPPHWGGYRLVPDLFEFWQGRVNRLHDRLRYRRAKAGWTRDRLSP